MRPRESLIRSKKRGERRPSRHFPSASSFEVPGRQGQVWEITQGLSLVVH